MIENGDVVSVDYTGRTADGEVFDTSRRNVAEENGILDPEREYEPLTFEVGSGEVIEGFEEGVVGMEEGETKEIEVPPDKGYGDRRDERVREYDYDEFSEMVGEEPEVGLHVHAEGGFHGDVTDVGDDVTVDFNHELAGESLVFDVEIVGVEG